MSGARDRLIQSAEKHLSRGKLDQALKDYLRLLEENPSDSFALNKAGDLCVRMGRPADGIGHFARIAESFSADGFFLKSIAIYKKINKIDPTRLDIYDRLAELYARQGLFQDARSHYQMLAEQSLKRNDLATAIDAYGKLAALDPTDLKVQSRLADLHRVAGQVGEAVARYDAIGGILQRGGAHGDAVAFFRKALDLDPADHAARLQIAASLIASNEIEPAVAELGRAPRTAEARLLLAEAELARGDRAAATAAAEDALTLESANESARTLLGRLRLDAGAPDEAVEVLRPAVEQAVAAGEFERAFTLLRPVIEGFPLHVGALEAVAEIREAEGDAGQSAAMRFTLGRQAETRGDATAAEAHYRRALAADPGHAAAAERLEAVAPGSTSAPPPATEAAPAGDAQAAYQEAQVLARYGLKDRAIERLRALVKEHPELVPPRERLVELLVEAGNPAAPREAAELANIYRGHGNEAMAAALFARLGLSPEVRPAAPPADTPPPSASPAAVFDEFEIEIASAPPPARGTPVFDPFAEGAFPAPLAAAPAVAGARPTPHSPGDTGFGLLAPELGSLIEEKMQRAAAEAPPAAPHGRVPAVDEDNLFADEQQFFNLAEALEKELSDDSPAPAAPMLGETQDEASLQEIFREFRRGVEQQLSAEDYETHYNLGIAYKEMGLLDEAIGEFQLASKAPALTVECCSLLGLCFLEKGMPQLAIKWYGKGLSTPGIRESDSAGLLYDLARVYEDTGDANLAYKTFLEVYGINTNYRDVVERVRHLEEAAKNSRESVH
jgi:tetratricopeptide (TPR) repeat protein